MGDKARLVLDLYWLRALLPTSVVLATTTYFHHTSLLGIFAVFAAILAIGLGRTIAGRMRAFAFLICHKNYLAFWWTMFRLSPS
jgi:hypothetical protein